MPVIASRVLQVTNVTEVHEFFDQRKADLSRPRMYTCTLSRRAVTTLLFFFYSREASTRVNKISPQLGDA